MPATVEQIHQFLIDFKLAAQRNIHFLDREKNFNFLLEQGMSVQERKEMLLGLQVSDYSAGPEVDDMVPKQPPCVWKFGVDRDGVHVYIKIKLLSEAGVARAKCMSFHEAEFLMRFPHRR